MTNTVNHKSTKLTMGVVMASLLAVAAGASAGPNDWQRSSRWLGPAEGAPILDQQQETDSGGGHFWLDRHFGQTFIPSMSAQLHHVDLNIDAWDSQPFYPATISIVQTVGGVPSGALLGSADVPGFSMGWNSIDFLPANVNLTAGVQYGIVMANDDADPNAVPTDGLRIQWHDNTYTQGALWQWTPTTGWTDQWGFDPGQQDGAFRTWMVPGPATLALLAIGALAVIRRPLGPRKRL